MMKNTVFNYDKKEIIGLVNSVDTGMSTAVINDDSTCLNCKSINFWLYRAQNQDALSSQ